MFRDVVYYFLSEDISGEENEWGDCLVGTLGLNHSWSFGHYGVSESVWMIPVPNPWKES